MMKKIALLTLGLATAFSGFAQLSVVKDAERAMKADKPAKEVVSIITPAFENGETATLAQTWYVPGKAAFKQFDKMLGVGQFKGLEEAEKLTMGHLLIDGYGYFAKALPLDSVPNEKGKIKPKYSKDIYNTLQGHVNDFSQYGVELYNGKDYQGAYEAWGIFCDLTTNPYIAKKLADAHVAPTDTMIGEVSFNRALAAWNAENLPGALAAFEFAKNHSYQKKQLYDYALAVATNLHDSTKVYEICLEALPLYGQEDPMYIGQIVNYYLQRKQFDDAFRFINDAIASDPSNAQYYVIQGILFENVDKKAEAKASYEKAVAVNPENAQAQYNYGRAICEEAYAASDAAPTNQAEYDKYYKAKIEPLFLQAAEILEKAYSLDNENRDVLMYLENIYYNLKDEAKMEDVKQRKQY